MRHPDHTVEEFRVPARMVGLIIGRGGDQLKKIERTSGCKVSISQIGISFFSFLEEKRMASDFFRLPIDIPGAVPERSVTVDGTPETILAAKQQSTFLHFSL